MKIPKSKIGKKIYVLREGLRAFFLPNPEKKSHPHLFDNNNAEANKDITWCLYEHEGTMGSVLKRCNWVNFVLKTKIMKPCLAVAKFFLENKLTKGESIPKEAHNDILIAYDKALEGALHDWYAVYLSDQRRDKHWWDFVLLERKKRYNNAADKIRFLHRMGLTIAMNDTAYREFFNLFALNVAKEIHEQAKKTGGHIHHLLFPAYKFADSKLGYNYYRMYPVVQKDNPGMPEKHGLTITPIYNSHEKIMENVKLQEEQYDKIKAGQVKGIKIMNGKYKEKYENISSAQPKEISKRKRGRPKIERVIEDQTMNVIKEISEKN